MSINDTKESGEMTNEVDTSVNIDQELTEDQESVMNEEQVAEAGVEGNTVIADLERLVEENQNRYLRAQADFDNFRRRSLKEKEELAAYASQKVISQLLSVLDNFQRALQTGSDNAEIASYLKGYEMIYRQLFQVLEAEGLKQMDAVGKPFDPELHQAIMQVDSEEHDEGIVVEVVQEGYVLKDKLLRAAMVKVSS
ncbi:MAG: nucleotide exchange factor GrpE [Candidatus Cohnella colombiensis]|uniref:Protein GrpE n=1 Tax=Candidatus Cohnella colombiensis TaxID=3121368 RepID=A0AA95JEB7_9BACL|nr:MAG: nucleotide exchange factor GrpE [Cohnella sp.]